MIATMHTADQPVPFEVVGGFDGSYPRAILVDATGKVIVSVPALPLPAGAATAANQTTEITALQNLVKALIISGGGLDWLQAYVGWTGAAASPLNVNAAGQLNLNTINSLPLPAGAATAANQATEIAWLTLIDRLCQALTSVGVDTLRTIITSSSLPAGASTSALQTTGNNLLAALANALLSINGDSIVIAGKNGVPAVAMKVNAAGDVQVDVISSALPAGAATSANQLTEITSLQLIDDLRNALSSVGADNLRIIGQVYGTQALPFVQDAVTGLLNAKITSSVLPAGAATLAEQQTQTTALQLIDNLPGALASVNTDSLVIRGTTALANVIDGYNDRYSETGVDLVPGAGPVTKDLSAVPAGEVWVIDNIWALDATAAKSTIVRLNLGGNIHPLQYYTQPDTNHPNSINGRWYLKAGDFCRLYFVDNAAGDDLYWGASGFKMKV